MLRKIGRRIYESGYFYDARNAIKVAIYGVFAPAKTPAVLINRINQQFTRVLQKPNVRERFLKAGVEPVGSSPREFGAAVKNEMTVMGKLIKDLGIHGE